MRRIAVAVLPVILSAATCFAAHPLVTDDAGTLGRGTVQLELNGDIGTDRETDERVTRCYDAAQVAATVGVGVSDTVDLTVGVTRPWGDGDENGVSFTDAGSSEFSLSMKWRIYEHEGLSFALKPQIGYSYAVGAPGDDRTVSCGALAILSRALEPFAFHLNAGYTYNDHNLAAVRAATRSGIWKFSLASTCDVIRDLKTVAEFGAATNEDSSASELPAFGLAGFIYSFNSHADLSAGVKVGLTKPESDLTGTFGLTLKF